MTLSLSLLSSPAPNENKAKTATINTSHFFFIHSQTPSWTSMKNTTVDIGLLTQPHSQVRIGRGHGHMCLLCSSAGQSCSRCQAVIFFCATGAFIRCVHLQLVIHVISQFAVSYLSAFPIFSLLYISQSVIEVISQSAMSIFSLL